MPLDLTTIRLDVPAIGGLIGIVGGGIGIFSGVAEFLRRRRRLVVTMTENNDAHDSWRTVTIANRSDLAVDYRDLALAWHIPTPFGRLRLNWAYLPEDETAVVTIPPHGTKTVRIDDEHWSPPTRHAGRGVARLRALLHLPSRGRGTWLPVRATTWSDDSWRERLLRKWYGVR